MSARVPAGRAAASGGTAGGLALELAKMRRLRTVPVAAAVVAATVVLSGINLMSADRATFTRPGSHMWEQLLLGYTLMAAITGPVLASVLASRQTDIEHSGAGWTLFATAGRTPGALCRAKLAALAVVVVPAVLVQSLALVAWARLSGVGVPLDAGPWALYTVELMAVDLALCAFHVWLAAVVENQLIGVGVGLIGSFIGVYMLLAPASVARLVPWGYYAVISCARMEGATARYTAPAPGWVAGFLVLSAVLFAVATRRLDRIER